MDGPVAADLAVIGDRAVYAASSSPEDDQACFRELVVCTLQIHYPLRA